MVWTFDLPCLPLLCMSCCGGLTCLCLSRNWWNWISKLRRILKGKIVSACYKKRTLSVTFLFLILFGYWKWQTEFGRIFLPRIFIVASLKLQPRSQALIILNTINVYSWAKMSVQEHFLHYFANFCSSLQIFDRLYTLMVFKILLSMSFTLFWRQKSEFWNFIFPWQFID